MTTLTTKHTSFLSTLLSPVVVWTHLTKLNGLAQQRAALRKLDTDRLCDLGLSRSQADAEASRPLWDAPHTWRC